MELPARYSDGLVAVVTEVTCRLRAGILEILDPSSGAMLARWKSDDVFPLHGRRNELRIGAAGQPYGARLVFSGYEAARAARSALPALAVKDRQDTGRQIRLLGLSTAALVSILVAYIYGVPLLANQITAMVPPAWEQQLGDKVAVQIEAALSEEGGFEVCDPDPSSVANRAITRFADAAMAEAGSPFQPDVKVVRSTVANAFALPGGKAFYFSALLDSTETPDEFAGVLAHELGHVAHRHALRQLIASAGTGLLIGFVLGDMTGISVAGGLGVALIDSHFSREEEAQADAFAAGAAQRLGFDPVALPRLLSRVAGEDQFTKALALLNTHPLTSERMRALEALAGPSIGTGPAFTPAEWQAIKSMCSPGASPPVRDDGDVLQERARNQRSSR